MSVDFNGWRQARRVIELEAEQAFQQMHDIDRAHWAEVSARGGTVTSSLTEEGQAAAAQIETRRDAQLARVDGPRLASMDQDSAALVAAVIEKGETFLASLAALQVFEEERRAFLLSARLPQRAPVADADFGRQLYALLERARRVVQPPTPKPSAAERPALRRPDFGGVLARFFG